MNFQEYLLNNGYKPFRKIYQNKQWIYTEIPLNGFSTSVSGGVDIRFIKDENEIIWGLSERNKPPTLIYPRPNIIVKKKEESINHVWDDAMNICLSKETPEQIFKAMYDKSKTFIYELND